MRAPSSFVQSSEASQVCVPEAGLKRATTTLYKAAFEGRKEHIKADEDSRRSSAVVAGTGHPLLLAESLRGGGEELSGDLDAKEN